jgi:prophage regulatory protein
MLGISRRQVYVLESSGDFPKRIHITQRAVGWLEHEVEAWIKQRMELRRQPRPRR